MNDEMLGHCIKILEQSIMNAKNESNCVLSTTEAYCIIGALEDNKAVPPNSIINHLYDERMWICGKCGAPLQRRHRKSIFCSNCGRKVKWDD